MHTGQQHDDVIVQAAIVKCEINLHNCVLFCWEQKSLSGHRKVRSRSPPMAFDSLRGFPRNRSNSSLHPRLLPMPKSRAWGGAWVRGYASLVAKIIAGGLELTQRCPLTKFHFKQSRVPLCKSISHFTLGLNGSPYDYVIHVALIGIPRCTTNCQLPTSSDLHVYSSMQYSSHPFLTRILS